MGKRGKGIFFLPKLPSEERILPQFHIHAFSSAHPRLLRSTEAALTVTLFYPVLVLSVRVMGWLQATRCLLAALENGPRAVASAITAPHLSRGGWGWNCSRMPDFLCFFPLAQYSSIVKIMNYR